MNSSHFAQIVTSSAFRNLEKPTEWSGAIMKCSFSQLRRVYRDALETRTIQDEISK
ncbi:MAG TPA: hypothetical protein VJ911_04205 [Cryomorphaceae bacterium]|nr:hypothetical protein [Cryomorphaceae bacterium]